MTAEEEKLLQEMEAERRRIQKNFLKEVFRDRKVVPRRRAPFPGETRMFHCLQDFGTFTVAGCYTIASADSALGLYLVNTCNQHVVRSRFNTTVLQFPDSFVFCAFQTRKDFGRSMIRTEKFLDKVAELFERNELDFNEYPAFSPRYFCPTNHPRLLRNALDEEITGLFCGYTGEVSAEFHDRCCVMRNNASLKKLDENVRFVNFAFDLHRLIGK